MAEKRKSTFDNNKSKNAKNVIDTIKRESDFLAENLVLSEPRDLDGCKHININYRYKQPDGTIVINPLKFELDCMMNKDDDEFREMTCGGLMRLNEEKLYPDKEWPDFSLGLPIVDDGGKMTPVGESFNLFLKRFNDALSELLLKTKLFGKKTASEIADLLMELTLVPPKTKEDKSLHDWSSKKRTFYSKMLMTKENRTLAKNWIAKNVDASEDLKLAKLKTLVKSRYFQHSGFEKNGEPITFGVSPMGSDGKSLIGRCVVHKVRLMPRFFSNSSLKKVMWEHSYLEFTPRATQQDDPDSDMAFDDLAAFEKWKQENLSGESVVDEASQ